MSDPQPYRQVVMKLNLLNLLLPHSKRKPSKTVYLQLEFHLTEPRLTCQEIQFLTQLRQLKPSLGKASNHSSLRKK